MPHQISTDTDDLGVEISFTGIVSGAELLTLNAQLISEESYSQCRYQVLDFSKATRLDVTTEQLRSIAMQDMGASEINNHMRMAIVGQPLFFNGLARIFQILEEVWTAYKPKFFENIEAAREWVSSDRT